MVEYLLLLRFFFIFFVFFLWEVDKRWMLLLFFYMSACSTWLALSKSRPYYVEEGASTHRTHLSRMVYVVNVSHVSDEDYFPQNLIGILIRGGVVGTTLRASAPFRCSICLGLGTSSIIIIHRRHQRVWGASYGYGWINGCMDMMVAEMKMKISLLAVTDEDHASPRCYYYIGIFFYYYSS